MSEPVIYLPLTDARDLGESCHGRLFEATLEGETIRGAICYAPLGDFGSSIVARVPLCFNEDTGWPITNDDPDALYRFAREFGYTRGLSVDLVIPLLSESAGDLLSRQTEYFDSDNVTDFKFGFTCYGEPAFRT